MYLLTTDVEGVTGKIIYGHVQITVAELNPICHLLALLGAHHILHVSWIRVKERTEQ
jgi:hypothetical protein